MGKNIDILKKKNELFFENTHFNFNSNPNSVEEIANFLKNYYSNVTILNTSKGNFNKINIDTNDFLVLIFKNEYNVQKNSKCIDFVNKEMQIRNDIKKELNYLHYNYSHKGTRYLEECIYQLYIKGEDNDNLSKDIYPLIAEKYRTNVNAVKCNINKANNSSYFECEEARMEEYFGFSVQTRPTTKEIIYAIMNKLKLI